VRLTDASEQFDSECGEDEEEQEEEKSEVEEQKEEKSKVEEQEEEKSKVADFRQSLHHRVEQSTNGLGHLQQLQH